MGLIHTIGSRVIETPLAELLRWYREALPARATSLEVTTPDLFDGVAAVEGVCLEQPRANWMFLSNRSFHDPVTIRLPASAKPIEQQTIRASGLDSAAEVSPLRRVVDGIELPPLSVTRLKLRPD